MKELRKKSISLFSVIMLSLIFSLLSGNSIKAEAVQNESYRYEIDIVDGTVTIEAYIGDEAEVVIPKEIEGYPVTKLDGAFYRDCDVQKVILPDTVIEITGWAFYQCTNLKEVVLNENLTTIDEQTFSGCTGLEKINLPESVNYIGRNAFGGCTSLKEIKIPSGITEIPDTLFYNCRSIDSINLPEGITKIGEAAFAGCESLGSLILPEGITKIEKETFSGCKSLSSLVLPKSIKEIYTAAFNKCNALTELCLPDDLEVCEGIKFFPGNTRYYAKEDSYIYKTLQIYGLTVIPKKEISDLWVDLKQTVVEYTGKDLSPVVTVKDGTAALVNNTDFIVSYNDNINIGTAEVIVKGIGKYTGSVKKTFDIIGHTLIKTSAKEASCTESGNQVYWTCASCHKIFSDETGTIETTVENMMVSAKGHQWDNGVITKQVKDKEDAVRTFTCTACGETRTESVEETKINMEEGASELENIPKEIQAVTDETIANQTSEDVKGAVFGSLRARATKLTNKTITLTWNKVSQADGYKIYGNKCGKKNHYKLIKDVGKSKTSYTQKKLKKGTYYKYVVAAYKVVDGRKVTIGVSKTIHAVTTGGKYGVAKSVKVNKTKVTLKRGKKFTIKAMEVKQNKTIKRHRKIAYESSNTKIATVSQKGVVKAKGKGTCYIYVYAQNGVYKRIKVAVK